MKFLISIRDMRLQGESNIPFQNTGEGIPVVETTKDLNLPPRITVLCSVNRLMLEGSWHRFCSESWHFMGFTCPWNEGGIPLLPVHSSQKLWHLPEAALQSSCQDTLLVGLRFVLSVNKYFLLYM